MIDFKNPSAMIRNMSAFFDRTAKRVQRELKTPAETLLREVKAQLSRPGTGKLYRRGRLGARLHRASRPGEPPAPDTKQLLKSARIEEEGDRLQVKVSGPGALALEFGSRDQKLQPRSYLRAALAAARARMTSAFTAKLRSK